MMRLHDEMKNAAPAFFATTGCQAFFATTGCQAFFATTAEFFNFLPLQ